MGISAGNRAANLSRNSATSSFCVNSKSTISPLLETPKGRALAIEIRGPGWKPPVKQIGREARRISIANALPLGVSSSAEIVDFDSV